MFYRYSYFSAPEAFVFQGTYADLQKYLHQHPDRYVKNGGNGSYVICGTSSGEILEFTDEDATTPVRSCSPEKDSLRTYFDKKRITENDYRRLADELNSGKLEFGNLENL